MRFFLRRRVILVSAVGATALAATTVVAGTTFGFFSSTANGQTNSFTSGTVTLTKTLESACNVTNMAPGDTPGPCTMQTTYSGSLSAYIAVDVLVETQAGSGGSTLYTGGGAGLHVTVTDNQGTPTTYTVPTASTTCPNGAPAGSTCYELDNELYGTSAYSNGSVDTITTQVSLPNSAGNGYQGASAQVILTAHAVQSKNNALACTTTATAGAPCTPSGSFAWS